MSNNEERSLDAYYHDYNTQLSQLKKKHLAETQALEQKLLVQKQELERVLSMNSFPTYQSEFLNFEDASLGYDFNFIKDSLEAQESKKSKKKANSRHSSSVISHFTSSNEGYKRLAQELEGFLFILSSQATILFASNSCQKYLGTSTVSMLGQSLGKYLHPDDEEFVMEKLRDAFACIKSLNVYCRFKRELLDISSDKFGDTILMEMNGRPVIEEGESCPIFLVNVGREYSSKNSADLDSILTLRMENIKLRLKLKAELDTRSFANDLSTELNTVQVGETDSAKSPVLREETVLKKRKKSKISVDDLVCRECGTNSSPEWRRGPEGPKTVNGQIVHLDYGSFQGEDSIHARHYFGIPYAAPPVGDLRFEHPIAPLPVIGLKRAVKHGKGCFQRTDAPPLSGFGLERSEDCLNLSIWAPRGHSAQDEQLPVMVWILPGGFTSGYVSNPLYNGGASFNYRVGLFGWTASKEFKDAGLLNIGMHDAIAAFKWIKKYIHKFGGDPNRVTAFGESAGGIMISFLLLINNGTQELFHSAIIESGPVGYTLPSVAEFQDVFDHVVDKIGCRNSSSVIQCMKETHAKDLIDSSFFEYNPYPVIDDVLVSEQPTELIRKGLISRVPIIIGHNSNEGTFFVEGHITKEDDNQISTYLMSMMRFLKPDDVQIILANYPQSSFNNSFSRAAEIIADRFFRCPSVDLAYGLASLNSTVFKYRWNHSPEILRFINFHRGVLGLGFHFSEVPFLFNERFPFFEKEENRLSDALIRAWVSFSSLGEPSLFTQSRPKSESPSIPWPPYNIETRENIVFQTPVRQMYIETDLIMDKICRIWSRIESKRSNDRGRITQAIQY